MTTDAPPKPALVKPKLRGIPHLVSACLAVPAVYLLVQHAPAGVLSTSALIYGLSLCLLLSTSALYHTPHWSPGSRAWLRRLDHSMIYVLIAGSYTPFFVSLDPGRDDWVLPVVWGTAIVGSLTCVFWPQMPRWFATVLYMIFGWLAVPFAAEFGAQYGSTPVWLVGLGGLAYSVGGVCYARKSPDLVPGVFGYHELFHVLVSLAAACHYAAVWQVLGQS
jgi:hemolysin III